VPGPYSRRTDHPYLVESLQDLPDGLRPLAEQTLEAGKTVETIFVMPAQSLPKNFGGRGGMHLAPDRALLFTAQGVLYVQDGEASGQPGQVVYLRGDQLLYTRMIQILLYGRLEFCGVEGDALKRIVVEYNTVGHDLLKPALQRFLRLAWGKPSVSPGDDHTEALLEALGEQSFKFRGGLRGYGLLPGERLLGCVFQPRIIQRVLGIFPRLAAPAALLALTENEIMLIEEGRTNPTSYGWFITLCPRNYVTGVEARPGAEWKDVHVHLKKGEITADHQVTLENAAAQAWQSLWSSYV
jgi:hypothetical protein